MTSANTINGKLGEDDVLDNIFGLGSSEVFSKFQSNVLCDRVKR